MSTNNGPDSRRPSAFDRLILHQCSDLIPGNWSDFIENFPVSLAIAGQGSLGMKTSRFSEQQIAFILKQAEDGTTVEEVCWKVGFSHQGRTRNGGRGMQFWTAISVADLPSN
ncbi:hypothetical protein SAMN02927924_04790 [Sphingobium faniae]|nr:hypothetical protein SAMN02927924_04790 [Sphingobium faniae]